MDRFEIGIKRRLEQMRFQEECTRVHNGGVVARGYKPDVVYRKNNRTWVVELESSTSRK